MVLATDLGPSLDCLQDTGLCHGHAISIAPQLQQSMCASRNRMDAGLYSNEYCFSFCIVVFMVVRQALPDEVRESAPAARRGTAREAVLEVQGAKKTAEGHKVFRPK